MAFSQEESAPLVGAHRGDGFRRRGGPQHASSSGPRRGVSLGNPNVNRRRGALRNTCTSVGKFVCAKPPLKRSVDDYYEDTFNDEARECTFGTSDKDGIWINSGDKAGTIMSSLVWVFIVYSMVTIALLAQAGHLRKRIAMIYGTICAMALASHIKTTFTDPGSIPVEAVPMASLIQRGEMTHIMCNRCFSYKPPLAHHCRICNRCISRLDHHCPWMNNCVGAANLKHFILFLCYTWTGCAFALILFGLNYFFCNNEDCQFSVVLVQLVRVMTLICIAALLFISSMLVNVMKGILTGLGTIDRMKRVAANKLMESTEEAIPLKDIFGIQGYWTWAFPIDPIFEDYDQVMGYSIPARLIRESRLMGNNLGVADNYVAV